MQPHSQFHSKERQETEQAQEQARPLEFATPEELLRHDAGQTPVPPSVARRLADSLAALPAPARPWWRRLFGL